MRACCFDRHSPLIALTASLRVDGVGTLTEARPSPCRTLLVDMHALVRVAIGCLDTVARCQASSFVIASTAARRVSCHVLSCQQDLLLVRMRRGDGATASEVLWLVILLQLSRHVVVLIVVRIAAHARTEAHRTVLLVDCS